MNIFHATLPQHMPITFTKRLPIDQPIENKHDAMPFETSRHHFKVKFQERVERLSHEVIAKVLLEYSPGISVESTYSPRSS